MVANPVDYFGSVEPGIMPPLAPVFGWLEMLLMLIATILVIIIIGFVIYWLLRIIGWIAMLTERGGK